MNRSSTLGAHTTWTRKRGAFFSRHMFKSPVRPIGTFTTKTNLMLHSDMKRPIAAARRRRAPSSNRNAPAWPMGWRRGRSCEVGRVKLVWSYTNWQNSRAFFLKQSIPTCVIENGWVTVIYTLCPACRNQVLLFVCAQRCFFVCARLPLEND